MAGIKDLSRANSISTGDLLGMGAASSSDDRALPYSVLLTELQADLTIPATTAFSRLNAAPSATGFTVTITDSSVNTWCVCVPAAAYAAGTFKFPAVGNAVDGQELLFKITQAITAVTWDGNGATIDSTAPSGITAGDSPRFKFDASTSTWYHVGS